MVEPLFAAPPTLVDPVSGTRAWCFQAARTVVDQPVGPMSLAVARFLSEVMEEELQRRWVKAGQKVRFVHDWRSCTSYENEARDRVIAWGRASRAHTENILVQLSPDASPFVQIAAQTGIGVLRMVKLPIELVSSLDPVVKELSAFTPG